jgi:hypothetical protein
MIKIHCCRCQPIAHRWRDLIIAYSPTFKSACRTDSIKTSSEQSTEST